MKALSLLFVMAILASACARPTAAPLRPLNQNTPLASSARPPVVPQKEEAVVPPVPPREVGPWRLSIVDVVFEPKSVGIHLKFENMNGGDKTPKAHTFMISSDSYIIAKGQPYTLNTVSINNQEVPPGRRCAIVS